jgi:hypothetical protein
MKNPRRFNDTSKLIGAAGGLSVLLAPVLAQNYASFGAMLQACAVVIAGAFLTFLAGLGTRSPGTEYTEVAEAKVKASMMPPAPPGSVAPTPPQE